MDDEESTMAVGDLVRARVRRFDDGTNTQTISWDTPYVLYDRVDEYVGGSRFIAGGSRLLDVYELAVVLEVSTARSFPYYSGQSPSTYLRILTGRGVVGWARERWLEKLGML